jgi:hypothetical protein
MKDKLPEGQFLLVTYKIYIPSFAVVFIVIHERYIGAFLSVEPAQDGDFALVLYYGFLGE